MISKTKPQPLDASVGVRGRVVHMDDDSDSIRQLAASKPAIGVAALGGGELDRTSLYDLGWKEGVHREARDGQGPKVPSLDSVLLPDIALTALMAPPSHFPRYLPVVFAHIGSFHLGALPVEVSTTAAAGLRTSSNSERK